MSTNQPVRSRGVASGRFWRNVTLIALAHIALIAMLMRWSSEARSVPDAQSLVWLSGAEDPAAERSEVSPPPVKASAPADDSERLKQDEAEKERPPLTQTKSEIELPTPQPTVHPLFTPKPAVLRATNPSPKTMKKIVSAKTSKPSTHPRSNAAKSREKQTDASNEKKKSTKTAAVKAKPSSNEGSNQSGLASKGAIGGGSNATEFGWYGNMLHDRFYSAWIQPTATVASGTKISTLVKVRIDKDGRVSKFEIIKPSGNVVVNESVRVVAKQVTQVDPPPTGLIKGDYYDVKINFELNTTR